ncbi:MAG: alpha/beta hydrolase family protein [Candidatus Levyibacteriota bacterium]
MKHKETFIAGFLVLILLAVVAFVAYKNTNPKSEISQDITSALKTLPQDTNPLSIQVMRQKPYPGSKITIVQTLAPGTNYNQYIASYQSDGLTIYALLTVPTGEKPKNGWPAIIFNHGHIPPEQYRTTERYVAYVDGFARSGYIIFKPDYRGNGNSQGKPEGAYYSPAYATDVLNALSSIKKYPDANPNKIGMWGHSMGGNITLRSLVVDTTDIKAAVIWGGVVGSYADIMYNWHSASTFTPPERVQATVNSLRQNFIKQYGDPSSNSPFWNSMDPTHFLSDISAPIQLDVGGADEEVPPAFSESLYTKLKDLNKTVEFYSYPGSDHNISQGFTLAMQRSIDFFDRYLK